MSLLKTKIETFENRSVFANIMLERYINACPNNIVSDIGAGFGHLRGKVESLGAVWQPFDYIKKTEKTIIWDLNNSAPKNLEKAGMVVFLEVLEHLANPLLGLQNISAHMQPGAHLILTTPNPRSSKNTVHLLLKGKLYAFQEKHLDEHHVFTPWEHIVQYFLEKSGFEMLEYSIVDTAYISRKPENIKDLIKKGAERILEKRNPKNRGMSYGMVAKKK